MARQVKNADKWHTFTMHQPIAGRTAELMLVGYGKRSYLWAGNIGGKECSYFSGTATLRKLAYAILKEVGPSAPVEEGAAE
jgi:hypothetical protein